MVHINSPKNSPQITASIVAPRGYSGLELARLLLHHPCDSVDSGLRHALVLLRRRTFPILRLVKCCVLTEDQLSKRP